MSRKIEEIFEDLKHKHYGIYGNHSAVEICEWNKKAIRGEGFCYKQKFYNVDCHRCAQITPSIVWCHQNCVFCWRPTEYMTEKDMSKVQLDEPEDIIEGLFKERKKLLSGFGGYKNIDKKKFEESLIPSHVAISLAGEPTLYPKLPEMIRYLKSKKEIKSIFVVTNGIEPKMIRKLKETNSLPIQLYLSIEASNKSEHLKINKPKIEDSWERLNETIELYPTLNCRRVVRFTLIKGLNDKDEFIDDFVKIFERTDTDFLEIKAYMFLGSSRKNLKIENMPSYEDCLNFAKIIEKRSSKFRIVDHFEPSRIVLLKNKNSKYKNNIK